MLRIMEGFGKITGMNNQRFAVAVISAVLLSGCYSIQVARSPAFSRCRIAAEEDCVPTAHMLVQNDGWFLFDRLPIVCGNANTESWFPWTFFKDEVSMEYVQKAIVRRAKMRGERIVQMNAINHNATLMSLPSTQGLSVPYLICHHATQISVVFEKTIDSIPELRDAAKVPKKPAETPAETTEEVAQ